MKLKYLVVLIVLNLLLFSCKKHSGIGGNSSIVGQLNVEHYNSDFSVLKYTEPAVDVYVYLVFGDQKGYGSRIRTMYDGSFEFNNLRVGEYTIYSYSMNKNQQGAGQLVSVLKRVKINKNKEIVDSGKLTISDNKAIGFSKITAKVKEVDTQTGSQYYKGEQRVYIIYDNDVNYTSSIKTNLNGEFSFTNLPKGTYTIYTYSKDVNNSYPGPNYPVSNIVEITDSAQNIMLPDFVIYK